VAVRLENETRTVWNWWLGILPLPSQVPVKVSKVAEVLYWSIPDCTHDWTSQLRASKVCQGKTFCCPHWQTEEVLRSDTYFMVDQRVSV